MYFTNCMERSELADLKQAAGTKNLTGNHQLPKF